MLPTRTLWKSETPLRCCKDLHVRSAWPWALRNLYRSTSSQLKNQVVLWLSGNINHQLHLSETHATMTWHEFNCFNSKVKLCMRLSAQLIMFESVLHHFNSIPCSLGLWPCKMNVVTCYDMWCPRVSFNSQHLWMRHKSTLRNSTRFSFIYQLPILQLPFFAGGSSHGAAHWFVMWRGTAPTPVRANELGQRHHMGGIFCSWLWRLEIKSFHVNPKAWRWSQYWIILTC